MSTSAIIVLAVIVVVVLWAIGVYNGLVSMRQRVNQAFADIDVQLRQRHDLVPNLVETVKGYAAHERGTLDEVVKARNAAVAAQGPAQQAAAENMLSGALRQLFALSGSLSGPQGQRQFPAIAGRADRSRKQDRGLPALLQQRGAGIQRRHPAFPRRFVRRLVRLCAEGFLRPRRRSPGRNRSTGGQVLAVKPVRYRAMAAYGLYSHIQSNRRRSIALLAGLFFLVYVLVYAGALVAEALSVNADINTLLQLAWIDFLKAAPFATVGTAAWIVIAYYFHQSMIDALTGGREVQRRDEPRLYNILENLCISRGITMPKLKVMDSDALNAFATGMNAKQYSITVTTGLLKTLDDAEIESVLGHELTHIRNGDVRMMVIAVIIAGVVSFFAELMFRLWFYNGFSFGGSRSERRGGGSGAGLAILIAVGPPGGRLCAVVRHSARVVALARIPRRCRLGGAHQESRRHDLGAAQDRRPRRT